MSNLAMFFFILSTSFIFLFWSRNRYSVGGLYSAFLVIMFQMMTPNFLAVAVTGVALPFLYAILLKKSDRCVFFIFPMALAACLKAILRRLLPFGVLLLSIFPPEILLFGARRNQLVNYLDELNF